MKSDWDPDIAAMNLSDVEKNGLQVFRNYTTSFESHKSKKVVALLNENNFTVEELRNLLSLIVNEQPLTLAVVACAYADDQLKAMFKREIPNDVPGGRNELLNGFGPLSRLSQRIQVAFSFGWLSRDLLLEIDLLRRIRNDISHKWDLPMLQSKLHLLIEHKQEPIEQHLGDGVRFPENFYTSLEPMQKFRVRLIWLMGRIYYECQLFVPILKNRLPSSEILYSTEAPVLLSRVSEICVEYTRLVIAQDGG